MKKALRRVLDQLLGATSGMLRKRTTTRDGLQEPQQMQALPVPASVRS